MNVAAVLAMPWIVGALATWQLPTIARRFDPGWSVRVLGSGALLLGAAGWLSACAAATMLLAERLAAPIAVLVTAGLAVTAATALRHGIAVAASLRAGRAFRRSPHKRGGLLVIDDAVPDAFAVPGRGGCVVVTTAMLDELDGPGERAAVLAHERCHLRRRHHLFIQAAELAACLNPLLRRWRSVVRFAAEREADECAAAGDRPAALRALARASLASHGCPDRSEGALGVLGADVGRRAAALRAPRPRPQRRRWVAAALIALAALGCDGYLAADLVQDRVVPESGESASAVIG